MIELPCTCTEDCNVKMYFSPVDGLVRVTSPYAKSTEAAWRDCLLNREGAVKLALDLLDYVGALGVKNDLYDWYTQERYGDEEDVEKVKRIVAAEQRVE